ncbi:MAG: 1-acyl-sn-glycerol-3-phosphate acyltransferase, partial [Saprospiraceae bacterium]|nr:1-acyl-sn-glycerol-3-phosphate acyltransferase [Saprospiraceae bacterium]
MGEQIQLYPHIEPDMEKWPIYRLSVDRKAFIQHLDECTFDQIKKESSEGLRTVLDKALYQERSRISKKPWRVDPPDERTFWKRVKEELEEYAQAEHADEATKKYDEILRRIINRYSEEVVGSFMPSAYSRARQMLTFLFKRLLIKRGKSRVWGRKEQLYHRIKLYGNSERIRSLAKIGTVVMVPTHFSNLDSLLIGYAIDLKVGLPSFSWGAGLNLYNFGPVAYFLNRIGTYRVDRRKKNPIYLNVLKNMSTLSMERGVHSLFYPGGTRSRSGEVDQKCKLGLLETTIEAQRRIGQQGGANKIFVVPLILDYHFVLEGKFLIEQ